VKGRKGRKDRLLADHEKRSLGKGGRGGGGKGKPQALPYVYGFVIMAPAKTPGKG